MRDFGPLGTLTGTFQPVGIGAFTLLGAPLPSPISFLLRFKNAIECPLPMVRLLTCQRVLTAGSDV